MTSNTEGVRIGPSSLATLIAALLLAVLAMLCAASAHAQVTMAQREAESTAGFYAVDSCGQRMLAGIDAATQDGASTAADVFAEIDEIRTAALPLKAVANAASQMPDDLSISAQLDGSNIVFSVAAPDGRTLNAKVAVENGKTSVSEWKLTGASQEASDVVLWSNTSNSNQ